jgi:hypothetical protein
MLLTVCVLYYRMRRVSKVSSGCSFSVILQHPLDIMAGRGDATFAATRIATCDYSDTNCHDRRKQFEEKILLLDNFVWISYNFKC